MSYKSKIKGVVLKVLDYYPPKLGYFFYHKIQNLSNRNNIEKKIQTSQHTYISFKRILEMKDISVKGKYILEIGSGWLPLLPYFFKFLGKAEKVFTYDLNRHYQSPQIKKLNKFFSKKFEVVIIPNSKKYNLPDKIEYWPNTDLVKLSDLNADLVFSRFVLEHITPQDLKKMHINFKSSLKPGTHIIHFISPSDHRSYDNSQLSLQDFLKYSESEWKKRQTKFDYHNRWRLPQYLELFKQLELEVIHIEYKSLIPGSSMYKKFKALEIHEDFQAYTDDELTAGEINVVLKI